MPIFFHVFSASDIMYYRMYLSTRQTCSIPMVHASFQTPQNVGNIEVVENVRVDVIEPFVEPFRFKCNTLLL